MKKHLFVTIIILLLGYHGYSQCDPVQNVFEDFSVNVDPNDRTVLPECWSIFYTATSDGREIGSVQQSDGELIINSTYGGIALLPITNNAVGTITFDAGVSSSVKLELGVYNSNGFNVVETFSTAGTHTYDFSGFSPTNGGNLIAFRHALSNGCCVNLSIDNVEYKSFCAPAANPTAIAKDITVKLDATGNVIVNPASVDNGSTDDCGEFITNFSLDKTLFTCDDLGTNNVTLTAIDSEGQTATAASVITVEPSFSFNSNQLALDENGEANAELEFLTASKTDCPSVTYALDKSDFTCADAGFQVLTVTASYNGLTTTFSATKSIRDYLAPEAIAQSITANIDEATGEAIVTTEMIDAGSSDNCGIASMTISKSSFNCADQGENEVILTVTDDAGLSSTATAIVTVNSFVSEVEVIDNNAAICFNTTTASNDIIIETNGSAVGTQYYLRDDSDSSVVVGPIDGTGTGLSFNAGSLTESTTFHVYAEIPFSGKALDLTDNGRDAHLAVNVPGTFDYASGYTFSMWVKLGSSGNSNFYNGIFYAGGVTGSDIEVYENSSGNITVVHNRGNGGTQGSYVISGDPITNNSYVHFAATYDGSVSRVYVNGVEQGASALTPPVKSASSEITFGYLNSNTFPAAQSFPGIVDDVRVYDQALTSTDFLTDYNKCISGTEDHLVLYYDLETVSGSIYTDLVSGTPAQIKNEGFATDDAAISCSFTCSRIMDKRITIGDATIPQLSLKNITVDLDQNSFSRTITLADVDNGTTDNCSDLESLSTTFSQSLFTCADVGVNTVMVTVVDEAGNVDSTEVEVTVNELIAEIDITTPVTSFCDGTVSDGVIISTNSSEEGTSYSLVNGTTSQVLVTTVGTGNAIDFNTGAIAETSTYYVSAQTGRSANNYGHDFNGSNARMDTKYALPQTSTLTMELWIQPQDANYNRLISNYAGSGSITSGVVIVDTFDPAPNDGRGLRALFGTPEGNFEVFVSSVLTLDEWNHVAITFDNGTVKLYVDGVKVKEETSTTFTEIPGISSSLYLAEDRSTVSNSTEWFNGQMDEFRVWNTVKTQEEIASNKGFCLQGNEENLIAYFPLDEGAGNTPANMVGGVTGIIWGTRIWVSPTNGLLCLGCSNQVSDEIAITIGATPASASAQDISVSFDATGSVTITPEQVDNGSVNECTIDGDLAVLTLDKTTFGCDDLGDNMVTLTVTDASSNVTTATAIVTILSGVSEQVITTEQSTICPSTSAVIAMASSQSGVNYFLKDKLDGSTIAGPFIGTGGAVDLNTGTLSETTTFQITALQSASTPSECEYVMTTEVTITVGDSEAPIVVTSDLNLILDINGAATIEVADIDNGSSDNCTAVGDLMYSLDITTFDIDDLGANTVTLSVTDAIGNVGTETAVVTVFDKEEQTVTLTGVSDKTFGNPDFTISASVDSSLPVTFAVVSGGVSIVESAVGLTGGGSATLRITEAGTAVVRASNDGDDTYAPYEENITITIAKADQVLTVEEVSNKSVVADPVTINATVSTDLVLTYSITGPATINDNIVTLDGTIGTVEVTVTQAGTVNYNAISQSISFDVVAQQAQTIVFTDLADEVTYGAAAVTLEATASSTLPVSFSITSGTADLNGNILTFTQVGTVVIAASQAGDVDFLAATAVEQTIVINKAMLTVAADDKVITYGADLPVLTFAYAGFVNGENETVLTATPTASLNIIVNGTDPVDAGSYDIVMSGGQATNYDFTLVNATLTINKADQLITLTDIEDQATDAAPFDIVATVDSGLPLTYMVTGPATVSGATITLDGTEGTVTVEVSQEGTNNFNASSLTTTFEVILVLSAHNLNHQINIYPNPTASHIYVDGSEVVSLQFYTLNGQLAKTVNEVVGAIDLQDLPAGVYMLQIVTNTEVTYKNIVKSN